MSLRDKLGIWGHREQLQVWDLGEWASGDITDRD